MKTNLKKLRTDKNFTRQLVASKIGVSAQYYGDAEKKNAVSIKQLTKICLALEYTQKEIAQIILKELELDVDLANGRACSCCYFIF